MKTKKPKPRETERVNVDISLDVEISRKIWKLRKPKEKMPDIIERILNNYIQNK